MPLTEAAPSPALSQVGKPFPVDGRKVGIVVDDNSDHRVVADLIAACEQAKLAPFVIGSHGGTVAGLTADRTYATARSFEFDAILLAGGLPPPRTPPPGLTPSRPVPRGHRTDRPPDCRAATEMRRHLKVLGAVGAGGQAALEALGVSDDAAGVVVGASADVTGELVNTAGPSPVWGTIPPPADLTGICCRRAKRTRWSLPW